MPDARTRRCAALMACVLCAGTSAWADPPYRSPIDLAFSPDGAMLAVSDHTAGVVTLIGVAGANVLHECAVDDRPAGITWAPDGSHLYVAESRVGTIADIDADKGSVTRRFEAGLWLRGIAFAPNHNMLVAADYARDGVTVAKLGSTVRRTVVPTSRQPFAVAISPDESLAVVSHLIPQGRADRPGQSAVVTLVDLELRAELAHIRLPSGSSCGRGVAIDPDGRRAYVVHTLGRTNLPTTQIERGWVNTNALSVIDLKSHRRLGTVLLDYLLEGAADPWGVAVAPDGSRLWVTLSGTHQLATIDLPGLSALLADKRKGLEDDIAALSRAGAIRRTPLPGKGPRGLAVSPDGKTLAVAMYFSGTVLLLDAHNAALRTVVTLQNQPEPDAERRGERIFHDATYSKQTWLSCATCHPDTRADGMNWDLLNDGLGNPKNVRSLVWSHKTPPVMSRGARASMEVASAAGFTHIAFQQISTADLEDVRAYLRSLEPVKSPFAGDTGPLAAQIQRGREVFEQETTGCARCHPAPLYTDLKQYDVGTRGKLDRTETFDTPTLAELWRTAPYLHDGSAAKLRDVLFGCNKDDRHGITSHLTEPQFEDLIAYLRAL